MGHCCAPPVCSSSDLLPFFVNSPKAAVKSYYKPVAYFVLLTAIYILLRSLIGYDPFNERMDQMQANDQVNTNLLQEAGIYMFKNINNILFLLVFGMALSFKLFFP